MIRTVLLAGGFGTRLRPAINDIPKPLAPIGKNCFLDYLLLNLNKSGLGEFTICVHYMAEKIIDRFADGRKLGISIDYSREDIPLGTGGAIGQLRDSISKTFCVTNADTYLELDIKECLRIHKSSKAIMTMAVSHISDTGRYGRLKIDENSNIIGFLEKDESLHSAGYINAGFYIMEPEIFNYIEKDKFVSLERNVFPKLILEGKIIAAYKDTHNFTDIGIPEDYERFKDWIKSSEEI